ncbi:rhomboid family intramembrane serine protease [Flavobacterium sp. 17A]|uniref:Rhomboid family intramembrane serine protease n=1 Tax=Flavobacterium potami TaxID=2872310 RepID=A0A9X1KPF1_9FLAO|nr:rhomboid family intramembrane serine protease [Flavobacterium potami]MBZ4034763.1 rhomboid family intramembrane serine protease [Flavobacterium potami]
MAVGFTPKHIEEFSLNELTKEEFLVLAVETGLKKNYNLNYISENGLIAYTNNGMFSWNAEIKIKIENDIASIQSASTGSEMVDWNKNKKNVLNFISSLEELKLTFTKEELATKYEELKDKIVTDEEDVLKLPPSTTTEKIESFFSIFKPIEGYFITPILLNLNILIFILMAIKGVNIFEPSNESLLNWGANFRPLTLDGQWWRLLTNCFLHIGIFHLLMNMYALLYIGVLLEPHLGKTRFISAYLLTGITASITSLWWHDLTISAGASGAIFGMYGVFLAMLTTNLIEKTERKALLTSISIFVGYNLIYGLKGGIDNAAHIGGLVGGLVIGYIFIPSLKKPTETKLKFGSIAIISALVLFSSFAIYKKIPNDIATYDAKIQQFITSEKIALEIYNISKSTPKEKILQEIKDKGIYNWQKNIKLVESFKELELPEEIQNRNEILKEYCQLRIKSYDLMYKSVSENSNQYDQQIAECNKLVEAKISELTQGQSVE